MKKLLVTLSFILSLPGTLLYAQAIPEEIPYDEIEQIDEIPANVEESMGNGAQEDAESVAETIEENTAETTAEGAEKATEDNAAKEAEVEEKNPADFSPDFMVSLYQCQPYAETKELYGNYETVAIIGEDKGTCKLQYEMFDLYVPTGLIQNIRSVDDILHLLHNKSIAIYRPRYNFFGLLAELNTCLTERQNHSARLNRIAKNEVRITSGLTSRFANDVCEVRLLNQLNIGEDFSDYSVSCRVKLEDLQRIVEAYKEVSAQNLGKSNAETEKADTEIMYRLQQAGFCQKPQVN